MSFNEETIWLEEGSSFITIDFDNDSDSTNCIWITAVQLDGDGYSKLRTSATVKIENKQQAVDIAVAILNRIQYLEN